MAIVSNSARTIRNKSFADGLLPQYQETLLAPNISSIQYLAIAGGGAGGVTLGGGGGAGGFIESYLPGLNTNILGNSVYFDGTGDYLRADAALDVITINSQSWTLECWVYPLVAGDTPAASDDYFIGMNRNSTGANEFLIGLQNVYVNTNPYDLNIIIGVGQWTHVAAVYSGSTLKIYINGVLSNTFNETVPPLNVCVFGIGCEFDSGGGGAPANYYTGYISNLRLVANTEVYTSNFTPPTSPLTAISGTSLLTCQSPIIKDNSINNVTITRSGGASVVANGPFSPNVTSTANLTLSIIIGAGGAGSGVASTQGANGGNTLIYSPVGLAANVIAVGGGGGGYYSAGVQTNGSNGGSGGGAGAGGSGQSRSGGSGFGYPSPTQQGNPGGNNHAQDGAGASAGGGGAGGATYPNSPNTGVGGNGAPPSLSGGGGNGRYSSMIGYPRAYAAGGGGGGGTAGGAHLGSGYEGSMFSSGSGTPGSSPIPAGSGNSNSGSGGGGGNASPLGNAGSGGSGIVILRYPDTFANATVTGNPNVYYRQDNIIYRFWQSGSITFADVPRYLL